MSNSFAKLLIYNHKGGVGKTTLTINIAAALVARGKKVLLVDTDPQCNLTSYLLDDNVVDELLNTSGQPAGRTIWSMLKPVLDGVGDARAVKPVETGISKLFLVPGDIRLSEYEQFLGDAWTDCLKRRLGAIRATTAISRVITELARGMDYVFFDAGPNIGPLNRVLMLDSDYFIVPVACDLFSVRALGTLGQSLKSWLLDWRTVESLAPDGVELLKATPRFLGYIPQRFKTYGRSMAQAPSHYLRQIERRVYKDLMAVIQPINPALVPISLAEAQLGQVKEFGVIIQEAQKQGVPISKVRGASEEQKREAWEAFDLIATKIMKRTA